MRPETGTQIWVSGKWIIPEILFLALARGNAGSGKQIEKLTEEEKILHMRRLWHTPLRLVLTCERSTSTSIRKPRSHTWNKHKKMKNTRAQSGLCVVFFAYASFTDGGSHWWNKQNKHKHKHKRKKKYFFFLCLFLCLFHACSHLNFPVLLLVLILQVRISL